MLGVTPVTADYGRTSKTETGWVTTPGTCKVRVKDDAFTKSRTIITATLPGNGQRKGC